MKISIISGGFDPVHKGHIRMFKAAKALADKTVCILNNNNWLKAKKDFVFMDEEERKEILEAIRYIDEVLITSHKPNDENKSVCNELSLIKQKYPNHHLIFANGGDRKADNIPEYQLCNKLNIEMVFNVGGEKAQSSSDLTKNRK
ncbi:adenylyltransferase/cytidyltransferase family protein [Candidatus Woesearchaeota archaeon]|nr:adenylyltransferase/cytidyltransferase family protein [Candidatus Woesearchaeota archaeon]